MRKMTARQPDPADALDQIDRPTDQFLQHRMVASRGGKQTGQRAVTRLEILLRAGDISPAAAMAGMRFARAWLMGCAHSQSASFVNERVDTSGHHDGADRRRGAFEGFERARQAIDGDKRDYGGAAPSDVLVAFLVDELTFSAIAAEIVAGSLTNKSVKRLVVRLLMKLERYYEEIDRKGGRGVAGGTANEVLKRFEPALADAA